MSVRSSMQRFHIPAYNRNAVIQLIAFSGVGFIAVHLVWITLIVYAVPEQRAFELTFRYIGIGDLQHTLSRWWTILTYGWCHRGFWEWLSNMLWLYCFGNVVQNLIGYKQVIPVFVYSILFGGLAYTGIQFLPSAALPQGTLLMGAQSGVIGLMAAALTLSPKYRLYLSDYFSVPLAVLAAVFVVLMLLHTPLDLPNAGMLLVSAFTGAGYITLLRKGYQPGSWVYNLSGKISQSVTPKEERNITRSKIPKQDQVDRILDKINEKGYHSLTQAEKDTLNEAGR